MAISTAVDVSAVARVLGIKTSFLNVLPGGVATLPQQIAVIAQGATASTYSTDKAQITSAGQAGTLFGFGSPIHLIAMKLFPANGVGGAGSIPVTVYPLVDGVGGAAAAGEIAGSGTQTTAASYRVVVNGIKSNAFSVAVGENFAAIQSDIIAAINAIPEMPVIAADATGDISLTAKWEGLTGNEITVEIEGTEYGLTFALTQPVGGLVDPDITAALALIGSRWETMVINGASLASSTDIKDEFSAWGEGRWGALVYKPAVVFTGSNSNSDTTLKTYSSGRTTDRVNVIASAPGSVEMGFQIAAAVCAQVARQANNAPAVDYGSLPVSTLLAGADGDQFDYTENDALVKAGVSTSSVRDGVVYLEDIITMYRPTGEPNPGYRYVVDIVKLQNIIFNIALIFKGKPWDGAPLIPNDQPTVLADARKPKDAIAELASLTDNLGLQAIVSDPEGIKAVIQAEISSTNPKRLDIRYPVTLSGNANIISADLDFAFFYG